MNAQRLAVGHQLNTSEIARSLGVSRTTVIKAVESLIDAGWVQSDSGQAPVVVARTVNPAHTELDPTPPPQNGFEHANQTDATYREILERVLRGDFVPGKIIKAKPLADELSISLTTIRQALEWLCRDGLVERIPRRGWKIVMLTLRDTMNIYDIRLCLEPMIMKSVVRKISQKQLDTLMAETDQMIAMNLENSSRLDHRQYDYEFHRTLLEISGNRMLLETLDPILRKLMLTIWYKRVSHQDTYTEHKHVLEAIQQRDAQQAIEKQRAHLRNALNKSVTAWE